ncbi:N-acetylglucosamine-6-phosphate deacetylase [Herbiconiux sp. A18JL235]|uniref:N-acetylglucosamine-6-phosphate deacetylase n=1 Tax=Herbiconiux sp. A18JL235 TaxID=3152363 RepID=A0AB39BE56_9MICO
MTSAVPLAASEVTLVVFGARRLDADGVVEDFWLAASGERIVETGTGDGWRRVAGDGAGAEGLGSGPAGLGSEAGGGSGYGSGSGSGVELVDAAGGWLTPGFIDLHAHGAGGFAFDDGVDAMRSALAVHRAHGTTGSVVSLVANPPHLLEASLDAVARLAADDPHVLGAHLEGPFLAPERKGAHNPLFLGHPTKHLVRDLLAASEGRLAQVTIAPELPDALEAIETFVSAGVVVAVGHTEADFDTARAAFDRGATLLTHAFNAMPGLHHRHPGPVAAALADPRVTLEIIADGVHVHPSLIALVFDVAPGRVALVTDAMAAAAAPDGAYRLGSLDVEVTRGRAVLAGADTIAGSTLTADAALRTALATGVDPAAAVAALTSTPARVLGRPELGTLRPGAAPHLVLLTPDFEVTRVFA